MRGYQVGGDGALRLVLRGWWWIACGWLCHGGGQLFVVATCGMCENQVCGHAGGSGWWGIVSGGGCSWWWLPGCGWLYSAPHVPLAFHGASFLVYLRSRASCGDPWLALQSASLQV